MSLLPKGFSFCPTALDNFFIVMDLIVCVGKLTLIKVFCFYGEQTNVKECSEQSSIHFRMFAPHPIFFFHTAQRSLC